MFLYEITFEQIIDPRTDERHLGKVTFNTEYSPAMLLFSNTLSNLLPKNIIIDMRTVELKLLKEIKDEKPKKKQRNK
jgi:hypothetical protein